MLSPKTPILHLYRHLLREASYLPPVCQPYATKRIKSQFDTHRYERPNDPLVKHHIKKAHHDLRFLRAANHGHMDNMYRVLLLTFGRTGKRRRELVNQLVKKELPSDTAELAKQMEETSITPRAPITPETESKTPPAGSTARTYTPLPPDFLDEWDLQKLEAFVKSQISASPEHSPRPTLKRKNANPMKDIPSENIFGRPLAKKLHRSKLRKAWVKIINRVLPPIPKQEWETLRSLALGEADKSLWVMPARRPMGTASLQDNDNASAGEQNIWDWKSYATKPTRLVERNKSRFEQLRSGERGDGPYDRGPIGAHTFTTRSWKRMYIKIWEQTATMEKQLKESGQVRWNVQWGRVSEADAPLPTDAQLEFFTDTSNGVSGKMKPRRRTRN